VEEELYLGSCGICGGRILCVKLIYPKVAQIIMFCEECRLYRRIPLSRDLAKALKVKKITIPGYLLGLKR